MGDMNGSGEWWKEHSLERLLEMSTSWKAETLRIDLAEKAIKKAAKQEDLDDIEAAVTGLASAVKELKDKRAEGWRRLWQPAYNAGAGALGGGLALWLLQRFGGP